MHNVRRWATEHRGVQAKRRISPGTKYSCRRSKPERRRSSDDLVYFQAHQSSFKLITIYAITVTQQIHFSTSDTRNSET